MDTHRSASARGTKTLLGLAWLLVLFATACEPAVPVATPTPPSARDLDCETVVGMTPEEAADHLEDQGWTVSWRREATTEEGVVSTVATDPPAGVITDVTEDGGVAIVFVTPSDDPFLDEVDIGAGCPPG